MKKFLIISFSALALFLVLVILAGQLLIQPIAKAQLDNYLTSIESDIYDYNYGRLHISLVGATVILDSVSIRPRQAAFDSLEKGYYEDLDELYARHIRISMSPWKYLTERKVAVTEVRIDHPEIYVFYNPKDTVVESEPLALREMFSKNFQGFEMNEFQIIQATFHSQNIFNEKPDIVFDSLNVELEDVILNSETVRSKPIGVSFKRINLELESVDFAVNEYYDFSLKNLKFEILANEIDSIQSRTSISIIDVHYGPNDLALQNLKSSRIRSISGVQTNEIRITGLQLGDLILEQELDFDEIKIISPKITQYVNSKMEKDFRKNPSKFAVKNLVEKISGRRVNIQNADMLITDIHKNNADLELDNLNIQFTDIEVNDETINESFGMNFSSGGLNADRITSDLGDFYSLETGTLDINFLNGSLNVNDIKLIPKQTKEGFSEVTPWEQDRFDLKVGEVNVRGLDVPNLIDNLDINMQALEIKNVNAGIYRDKWVEDREFKFVALPSRLIREAKFPLNIDTFLIVNANIMNEQLGDIVEYEDEKPGAMYFDNLYATGYDLTNDPQKLKFNPEFVIDAQATFMKSQLMEAQYRFVIPDTMDIFYVTGGISNLPTEALDPLLKNLLLVELPGGMIHSMTIDMVGNDTLITGSLEIEYENLHVNILKTKKPAKSSGFMNTMGNTVLKNNNLRTKGRYVTGIVNAPRKRNKFVFNFSWQGIKSGLISTMVPFVKAEKAGKNKKNKSDPN